MINSFLVYNDQDKLIIAYSNPSISFYRLTGNTFVFEVETNRYNVYIEDDFRIQMDAPVCLVIKGDEDENSYKLDFNKSKIVKSKDFI